MPQVFLASKGRPLFLAGGFTPPAESQQEIPGAVSNPTFGPPQAKSAMNKLGHSLWLFFGGRKRLEQTLRRAAAHDDDATVILTLIDMGARVDAKDPETGHTPLLIAVQNECRSVIVALLSFGADIHVTANNGKSALDAARQMDKSEIVKLLQEAHQANQDYTKHGADQARLSMPPALTLAVFAKPPVPGRVKSRLCPPLEPETAAHLYAAFVRDTVRKAAQIVSRPTLFYADGDAELRELFKGNISQLSWTPQGEGDLGARMARVPAPCLILGTDSPHLPVAVLRQALNALNTHDVVLGPAEDGGYYLIGLRAPAPVLFEGIAWSTAQVFAQTQTRAQSQGLTTHLLPLWYDIDTIHDLRRLDADLDADCPATRAVLDELRRTVQLF